MIAQALGAGLQLGSAAFKLFQSIKQKRQANQINPVNPGYQQNTEVLDNARILTDRYNNYETPGIGQLKSDLNTGATQAYANASQAASSSGDALDAATKIAYSQGQNINALGLEQARGKEAALADMLSGKAAAGEELQAQNAYDRQQYENKLKEKAALIEASAENGHGAIDSIGSVAGTFLGGLNIGGFRKMKALNPMGSITGGVTPSGTMGMKSPSLIIPKFK